MFFIHPPREVERRGSVDALARGCDCFSFCFCCFLDAGEEDVWGVDIDLRGAASEILGGKKYDILLLIKCSVMIAKIVSEVRYIGRLHNHEPMVNRRGTAARGSSFLDHGRKKTRAVKMRCVSVILPGPECVKEAGVKIY
jgi:hypothetical protein